MRLDLGLPGLRLALVEGGELFFGKNFRQFLSQAGSPDEAARLRDHLLLPLLRRNTRPGLPIERGAELIHAGTFTIYLDNLRIRHHDGRTTPLWTSGKDTRAGKFTADELFTDLKIRAVSVPEVGK